MSRLTDHKRLHPTPSTPADPLPASQLEGDSADAEIWDHDEQPPGIDRRTGQDHRTELEQAGWQHLVDKYGGAENIPYEELKRWERGGVI